MAVTSPVVCARSLCREALTRTHMHVKHRTGMTPPFPEGGSAAAARVSWKLAKTRPVYPHTIVGSVGLGDFDQDRVWGCQDGRGLGGPALQGSERAIYR